VPKPAEVSYWYGA